MILYAEADSKKGIGYVPDWMKVRYEKDDQRFELTLDISGEINYNENKLDCRCKGELTPWVLLNLETGEETDLSVLSVEECNELFSIETVAKLVYNSDSYRIGVYPIDDRDEVIKETEDDVFGKGKGAIEISNGFTVYEKDFEFEVELNI